MSEKRDERIETLRQMIRDAFPDVRYDGRITPNDEILAVDITEVPEILDDDHALFHTLKGKSWTLVSTDFLDSHQNDYLLLVDEAYVAFIAAWLTYSLEEMDAEDLIQSKPGEVRELLICAFGPYNSAVPDLTSFRITKLKLLNPQQRNVVLAIMQEFSERLSNSTYREAAMESVSIIMAGEGE